MFTWQKNRNVVRAAMLLLLIGLPLIACDDDPPTVVRPTAVIDPPEPAVAESKSLSRRDVPPSGVAAQLGPERVISTNRGSLCESRPQAVGSGPLPPVEAVGCSPIPSYCTICLEQFEANQEVLLSIQGPDPLSYKDIPVQTDNLGSAEWVAQPFWTSGEYEVSAVIPQSSEGYAAKFTIQDSPTPRILVAPEVGPPGMTFTVYMYGFQLGENIEVHLAHKNGQGAWEYVTELPPTEIDPSGWKVYLINTQPGDPEGNYKVLTVPESNGSTEFRVGN